MQKTMKVLIWICTIFGRRRKSDVRLCRETADV